MTMEKVFNMNKKEAYSFGCFTSRSSLLCKLIKVDQFFTSPWKDDLARSMGMVRCPTPASRVRQIDLIFICKDVDSEFNMFIYRRNCCLKQALAYICINLIERNALNTCKDSP